MSEKKLAIILINWNNGEDTIECLQMIDAWRRLRADIWVVDNASSDGSPEQIASRFPGVLLLRNRRNLGFAGGNNAAIRSALQAGSQLILLLNNDARLEEESALGLMQALDIAPGYGLVGPLLEEHIGNKAVLYAGGREIAYHVNTRIRWNRQLAPVETVLPVDYVPGTAVLIRADVFKEVGMLDEDYFFSGEIADFCRRARTKGYRCGIAAHITAAHHSERAGKLRQTLYLYYSLRNRLLYTRKFASAAWLAAWAGYDLFLAGKRLAGGDRPAARAIWLALVDGLAGRYGNRNSLFGLTEPISKEAFGAKE